MEQKVQAVGVTSSCEGLEDDADDEVKDEPPMAPTQTARLEDGTRKLKKLTGNKLGSMTI